ncbi:MAG TPA: hypothetical protein VMZ91_06440 [Candidatus Paceibacterota bacterium]|nr:hypothetical protein [Candidatus Paceibacterota bacterium]
MEELRKLFIEIFDDIVDFIQMFYIIVFILSNTGLMYIIWKFFGFTYAESDFFAILLVCPLGFYVTSVYKKFMK